MSEPKSPGTPQGSSAPRLDRRAKNAPARRRRILATAMLGSGAALLTHIIGGFSLRWAFACAVLAAALTARWVWRRSSAETRAWLRRLYPVAAGIGFLATLLYDLAKFILTRWEALRFNPFEAIRVFGVLLAGPSASPVAVYTAGTAFHVVNGVCFGIAFCIFRPRGGVLWGTLWGVFLELFQLAFYPDWLKIARLNEFIQVSFLSHVVYGAVLGGGALGLAAEEEQR